MKSSGWSLALVLSATVLAGRASAADHNNWRTFPLPTNAVTPIHNTGTTTSYLTNTDAWFYSGVTKEWRTVAISNPSYYQHFNAHAVVQDGTQIHAFSTRTGEVATLNASAGATIVSGPTSNSWITLVADGTQAWGYSSFLGTWEPLALSQPNPTLVSFRVSALLQDGNTVYGFSLYYGTFVPVAADALASPVVSTGGEVATAHSPGILRCFSANQNVWGVQAFPHVGPPSISEGLVLAFSNTTAIAFSGLTGTFDSEPISGPPASFFLDAMAAGFADGGDAVCYGAGQGQFQRLPGVTTPTFTGDYHFVMVVEPTQTTPFSGVTSTFGSPIAGAFAMQNNEAMAFANGSGTDYAYSPFLNTWTPAPNVTLVAPPVVTRAAVLLPHTGGYEAISTRYGVWRSQPTGVTGVFEAPTNASAMLVHDGSGVAHVFDTRIDRWATANGTAPFASDVSRHAVLMSDGNDAFGYGLPTSRWDKVSLNGWPLTSLDLSSSTGIAFTTQEMHLWCVTGSLSYDAREPEFSRSMKLGNTMRMHQVAPAGSALVALIGAQPDYLEIDPVSGILFMDPSVLIPIALPAPLPANGLLQIDVPLPNDPSLVGAQPHLQNIVFPPSGAPWLSTSVSPFLY